MKNFLMIVFVFSIGLMSYAKDPTILRSCLQDLEAAGDRSVASKIIDSPNNLAPAYLSQMKHPERALHLNVVTNNSVYTCTANENAKGSDTVYFKISEKDEVAIIEFGPNLALKYPLDPLVTPAKNDRRAGFVKEVPKDSKINWCSFSNSLNENEIPELLSKVAKSLKSFAGSPFKNKFTSSVDLKCPKPLDPAENLKELKPIYKAFDTCSQIPVLNKAIKDFYIEFERNGKQFASNKAGDCSTNAIEIVRFDKNYRKLFPEEFLNMDRESVPSSSNNQ